MTPTDALSDERTTFRCPVTESRRQCALRIGAEVVAARLIDESAGGFALLIDHRPELHVSQTVLLQTDSGLFNVRVKSIVESSPPEDDGETDSAPPVEWIRLGLQRLGDAVPPAGPTVSPFTRDFRSRLRQWPASNRWVTVSGALLALAAVSFPLGVIAALRYAGSIDGGAPSVVDPFSPASERASNRARPPAKPRAADNSGSGRSQPVPPGFDRDAPALGDDLRSMLDLSGGGGAEARAFESHSESELRDLVRRLPGPTALTMPDVVRLLRLTEEQQSLIQQLIDAMAEAMQTFTLDPDLRGAGRNRINRLRDELQDDYLRRALDLLSPEQQEEWNKLRAGQEQ